MKNYTSLLFVILVMLQFSCKKDYVVPETEQDLAIVSVANDFTFSTVKEIAVDVFTATADGTIVANAIVDFYTSSPLSADGSQGVVPDGVERVGRIITDASGHASTMLTMPANTEKLYAATAAIGLVSLAEVAISGNAISLDYSTYTGTEEADVATSVDYRQPTRLKAGGTQYQYLGTFSSSGLPDYLEPHGDKISSGFLDDVTASLPEGTPLPVSHPQYLKDGGVANVHLVDNAELWVTFVHEGAGWQNVLGYFYYQEGNAPQTVDDIENMTIIFPNCSYRGSGGSLRSGDKVQLKYFNTETNAYEAVFPAQTVVGWFLLADGWNGSVTDGNYRHFSLPYLNVESDPAVQQHNVLLNDNSRNLFLLSFEDIRRDVSSCDQDFNDAVFYVTASPYTAVESSKLEVIDSPQDTDGDGATDVFDEYPNDATKAFNNYYPGQGLFATLLYEDLWPHKGDYDFNDLVVDYSYNQITNAQNELVRLESDFRVKAIGAGFHNAFAVSFSVPASNISTVEGQVLNHSWLQVAGNGAEAGQTDAVIPIFDDAFDLLPHPGTGNFVNTESTSPYVTPQIQRVAINFTTGVALSTIGTPPYNPFIITNRQRGVEVHLPGQEPTQLADPQFFGTGDDQSPPAGITYYHSGDSYPWAINLPVEFRYPSEKNALNKAYLKFDSWVESRGFNYMDWYTDHTGYRNPNYLH